MLRPYSIRPLFIYTFADVVLPDESNSSIPWGTITTPTGIIRNSSALFRLTPIQPQGGVVERMLGEDLSQAAWAPLVPNDEVWLALSPGDGKKTVHARFRDATLTEQDALQPATLIVDSRPPVITNQSPTDGATGVLPMGLVVSADWPDDTSASQDVAGVDARAIIEWISPRGWSLVTDHPTMTRTDTGFTFAPTDVRPGERYEIRVSKPDLAGNWVWWATWSFET